MMNVDATHQGRLPDLVSVDDVNSSRSDVSVSSVRRLPTPGLDASTVAGNDLVKQRSVASRQHGQGGEGLRSPTCQMTKCQRSAKRLSKISKENLQLKEATLKFELKLFELNGRDRKVWEQERDVRELKEDVTRLIKRMRASLEDLITLRTKTSTFSYFHVPGSNQCHQASLYSMCEASRATLPLLSSGRVCLIAHELYQMRIYPHSHHVGRFWVSLFRWADWINPDAMYASVIDLECRARVSQKRGAQLNLHRCSTTPVEFTRPEFDSSSVLLLEIDKFWTAGVS